MTHKVSPYLLFLTLDAWGGAYNNKDFILLYWLPMNENIVFIFFYDPDESEYSIYSESLHPDDRSGMKTFKKQFSMQNDVCSQISVEK